MAVSAVPAPLEAEIQKASSITGVPKDLLEGIWRIESGSTYPNRAVNSSGYGGLFGTKYWNAPEQQQADEAATILAAGLVKYGGNVGAALSYYNAGKYPGGYTSVPGETTFGRIPVSQRLKDSAKIQGVLSQGVGSGGSPFNFNPATGFGIPAAIGQGADSAVNWAENKVVGPVEKAVLRGLFIVVGLGILMLGIYLVVRAMGVNVPAPPVVGRVAGKIPSGGSPRRKGNAAISRGEGVTRTSAPGRHTVSDRVRLARNERARKREARAESQRRDEEFGGIPF